MIVALDVLVQLGLLVRNAHLRIFCGKEFRVGTSEVRKIVEILVIPVLKPALTRMEDYMAMKFGMFRGVGYGCMVAG